MGHGFSGALGTGPAAGAPRGPSSVTGNGDQTTWVVIWLPLDHPLALVLPLITFEVMVLWEAVIAFTLTYHSGPYGSIERNSNSARSPLSPTVPHRPGSRAGEVLSSYWEGRGSVSSNASARHWGFPGDQQRGGPASPSSPTEGKETLISCVGACTHTATRVHTRTRAHAHEVAHWGQPGEEGLGGWRQWPRTGRSKLEPVTSSLFLSHLPDRS